jgi:outer membrane lipoprotein SlyB
MKNALLAFTLLVFAAPGCAADPAAPGGKVSDCADCGTVRAIDPINQGDGKASGAGAVLGAVIGGVVGHQFGSGRGQDAATAAGAVGGAAAGHQMEKNRNAPNTVYRVTIDMDRGLTESITVPDPAGLRNGDRVRVVGRNIERIR